MENTSASQNSEWEAKFQKRIDFLLEHGPKELVGAFGKAPFHKYPENEEDLLPEGWSPEFVNDDVDLRRL